MGLGSRKIPFQSCKYLQKSMCMLFAILLLLIISLFLCARRLLMKWIAAPRETLHLLEGASNLVFKMLGTIHHIKPQMIQLIFLCFSFFAREIISNLFYLLSKWATNVLFASVVEGVVWFQKPANNSTRFLAFDKMAVKKMSWSYCPWSLGLLRLAEDRLAENTIGRKIKLAKNEQVDLQSRALVTVHLLVFGQFQVFFAVLSFYFLCDTFHYSSIHFRVV
jgi:hypothetical protein